MVRNYIHLGFLGIFYRMHGMNSLEGHAALSQHILQFSSIFFEKRLDGMPVFWHADVSWSHAETIRFTTWSFVFPYFGGNLILKTVKTCGFGAFSLIHTPLHISMISGMNLQGMWSTQVIGQVTETHRLKVNNQCDIALFHYINWYTLCIMNKHVW